MKEDLYYLRRHRNHTIQDYEELRILRALTSSADRRNLNRLNDRMETLSLVIVDFDEIIRCIRDEIIRMEKRIRYYGY